MAGSATLTTVMSRMSISCASDSSPSTSQRRERGGEAVPRGPAVVDAGVVIDSLSYRW
jgi:hypothetical protein